MEMEVEGLGELVAGGVHIHEGTSCDAQGGHYWNDVLLPTGGPENDGDAWYNIASKLAPTGTGYSTDKDGEGVAYFFVKYGYGFEDTVGKVVIIHGEVGTQAGIELGTGGYPRIAAKMFVREERGGEIAGSLFFCTLPIAHIITNPAYLSLPLSLSLFLSLSLRFSALRLKT